MFIFIFFNFNFVFFKFNFISIILTSIPYFVISVFIINSVATNYSFGAGSGIFCSGPATISDSVIRGNYGGGGGDYGGTIFLQSSSNRSAIIRCDIRSNSARFAPSGISSFGSLDLRDSLVRNNRADNGDAGFVNYGTATVRNCTFTSNWSFQGSRESFSSIHNNGDMSLDHLTIVSNSAWLDYQRFAVGGAGLLNGGTMRIKNSLIAWNVVPTDPDNLPPCQEIWGYPAKGDHNLIQNPGTCAATSDPNGDLYGQDPLIGPLADNGGPTLTHALLPGSPAINAGVESDVTLDQRGLPRSRPDIGAYEVLERSIPVLLPLPNAHASTFQAVLVGDPRATYLIQHKDSLGSTEWQDSGEPVLTDGGGFVNVSMAIAAGSGSMFIRAVKR